MPGGLILELPCCRVKDPNFLHYCQQKIVYNVMAHSVKWVERLSTAGPDEAPCTCFSALEIMGPGYRTFAGMMICLFFAVALMILSLLAYIFNSWFALALVTSVPFASLFR